jgi:hypothetical protein
MLRLTETSRIPIKPVGTLSMAQQPKKLGKLSTSDQDIEDNRKN